MNLFKSEEVCASFDINSSKDKLIFQSNPGIISILDVKTFKLIFLISNKDINSKSLIYFLDAINFIVINDNFYFKIFSIMEYKPLITCSKYCYDKWRKKLWLYIKNEIFQIIEDNKFIISNFEEMKLFQFKNNKLEIIGNFKIRIYSILFLNNYLYIGIDKCVRIYTLENNKQ